MAQTFAQYLVNHILPEGMHVTKPMDAAEVKRILTQVYREHPDSYPTVVSALKRLGDKFSTLETVTLGMEELAAPNKEQRDALFKHYIPLIESEKDSEKKNALLGELQEKIVKNDNFVAEGSKLDESTIASMAGSLNKAQLVKTRTSPVVVKDNKGNIVPEVFTKSYSQGQDVLHHWLQSTEARENVAAGRVATSEPGVYSKIIHNIMIDSVVSMPDCKTKQGILLDVNSEDVLGRFLAQGIGPCKKGDLMTPDVQQALLKQGIEKVCVRSPQTCEAPGNTVCARCYGHSNNTNAVMPIGTHVGAIAAGTLAEPLTQMALSAKHSVTMAGARKTELTGMAGFSTFVEAPRIYPDRKLFCEVTGVITNIQQAPQGGKYIIIRQTQKVPDRYIVHAITNPSMGNSWMYYVSPKRTVLKDIKPGAEVYPGMELTDGITNLQDVSRLFNIGIARSVAAQGMQDIYKATGKNIDRRHFELLAKNAHNYVKMENVPKHFPFGRGEIVQYSRFKSAVDKLNTKAVPVDMAVGQMFAEPIGEFTVGTEISSQIAKRLKALGVSEVKVSSNIEVSPVFTPMTNVPLLQEDWLSALNHRFLKATMKDAAATGRKSDIHGHSPIASYVYGAEMSADTPTGCY